MFRLLKSYMRKHVVHKVVSQKERVGNTTKKQKSYCYRYCFRDKSFFPDHFKKVHRKFRNCKRTLVSVRENNNEKGTGDTFTTGTYPGIPWIEAVRWSGTLAFGWALTQNFHFYLRRRRLQDYITGTSHQFGNSNLQKHLCPHYILKNVLLGNVLAQPNDFVDVKSLFSCEKVPVTRQCVLPIYGPKTADQALSEATDGIKKVRDETVGELENRLGLRCMLERRYRKAVIHFAAGSALQNSAATFNLAQCYELGLGTPQNYEKAAKCYRVASDQGNASATYNLAVFYAHGYGGLKTDRKKALKLLESAVALGEPNAKQLLERYVSNSTLPTVKKETELRTTNRVKNSKELATKIGEVKSDFRAFQLPVPLIERKSNTVGKVNVKCRTKSNSISTDDGLASEYESSNSSIVSCSSSGCRSGSSGSIYQDETTADRSSSTELSNNCISNHSKLDKLSPDALWSTSFQFLKFGRAS